MPLKNAGTRDVAPITNGVYREYQPTHSLRAWVDCFWYRNVPSGAQHSHRVLPDGCIDILFELDGNEAGSSYVVGMMTRPLIISRDCAMKILAVRFRPGAAAVFFREPLCRLTDTSVDLQQMWRQVQTLPDQVASLDNNARRIARIEQELLRRVLPLASDSGTPAAALSILARQPGVRIDQLCRDLSISRQGLAKSFRNHVGVSPKALARILRMQTIVRQIGDCPATTVCWADLAHKAGYFDQSHMIHEIEELSGLTPHALLQERRQPVSIFPIH